MTKHNQRAREDSELRTLRKRLQVGKRKVKEAQEKAGIQIEKSKIKKELLLLKHPRKVALAQRLGRGLKVTGRKVGRGLIKQGKLIQQQQERDRRLEVAKEKRFSKPVKVRKSKKKKGQSTSGFNPLADLDF